MTSSTAENPHEPFVRQAIALASSAVEHGNHPFGACLVSKDGQVLLTAENTTCVPENDCTRHAELNLISMATQKFARTILEECTLYTSCEPCLMCTGAFRWSGIRTLVYALRNETLGVSSLGWKKVHVKVCLVFRSTLVSMVCCRVERSCPRPNSR